MTVFGDLSGGSFHSSITGAWEMRWGKVPQSQWEKENSEIEFPPPPPITPLSLSYLDKHGFWLFIALG